MFNRLWRMIKKSCFSITTSDLETHNNLKLHQTTEEVLLSTSHPLKRFFPISAEAAAITLTTSTIYSHYCHLTFK